LARSSEWNLTGSSLVSTCRWSACDILWQPVAMRSASFCAVARGHGGAQWSVRTSRWWPWWWWCIRNTIRNSVASLQIWPYCTLSHIKTPQDRWDRQILTINHHWQGRQNKYSDWIAENESMARNDERTEWLKWAVLHPIPIQHKIAHLFWRQVFPVNHLHCYWQLTQNKEQ